MHHCFTIYEIVIHICEELVYRGNGNGHLAQYSSYGTIAALAVTCKTIQDPALNILWSTHESLIPLLRCMPTDLWSIEAMSDVDDDGVEDDYLVSSWKS